MNVGSRGALPVEMSWTSNTYDSSSSSEFLGPECVLLPCFGDHSDMTLGMSHGDND